MQCVNVKYRMRRLIKVYTVCNSNSISSQEVHWACSNSITCTERSLNVPFFRVNTLYSYPAIRLNGAGRMVNIAYSDHTSLIWGYPTNVYAHTYGDKDMLLIVCADVIND